MMRSEKGKPSSLTIRPTTSQKRALGPWTSGKHNPLSKQKICKRSTTNEEWEGYTLNKEREKKNENKVRKGRSTTGQSRRLAAARKAK
ncbi:hypothetical protein V6N11_051854 [Hibiscus sabdariffa]|uniref:Uncharacterized protein n=1 Tax=Hibiscus sabdariffa TaxID=183260 RepID=A0ABR2U8R3_9ROSI